VGLYCNGTILKFNTNPRRSCESIGLNYFFILVYNKNIKIDLQSI
jgi:hypothetical protein